jgi:hypothetical protein
MADETRANYPDLIKLEMTDGTLRKKKTRMNTSLNREREKTISKTRVEMFKTRLTERQM